MKNILFFLVVFLFSFNANTQIYESYKHVPETVDFNGLMGGAMDIDDEWAVVGAKEESQNGAIHIYRRVDDEWVYFQRKTPFDQPDDFGDEVAVEGNVIAVAATDDDELDPEFGSVYMYKFNGTTWNLDQKINNPTNVAGGFATDVELDNSILYVGSSSVNLLDYGIFLYEDISNNWELQEIVQLPDSLNESCGFSISVDNDILIGSRTGDDDILENSGACCFFKRIDGVWEYQQKIKADVPETNSGYGFELEIDGERLVVGSPLLEESMPFVGAVYYYELENGLFEQKQKISPEAIDDFNYFGTSIDIEGQKLVIGASQALNDDEVNTGEVFSYELQDFEWSLMSNLLSSDGNAGDVFGISVGIYNEGVIVSALGNDEGAQNGGAVYFFEDVFVGIEQEEDLSSLKVYPNPTKDYLQMKLPENVSEFDYRIVNIDGQLLQC